MGVEDNRFRKFGADIANPFRMSAGHWYSVAHEGLSEVVIVDEVRQSRGPNFRLKGRFFQREPTAYIHLRYLAHLRLEAKGIGGGWDGNVTGQIYYTSGVVAFILTRQRRCAAPKISYAYNTGCMNAETLQLEGLWILYRHLFSVRVSLNRHAAAHGWQSKIKPNLR